MSSAPAQFVVGFDLDGVIIDHTQNKLAIALRYGISLRPEDTHSEKMASFFSPELYHEIQAQLYGDFDDEFAAPLMEGAYRGLATLKEKGIPYFLISRRKKPLPAIRLLKLRELWGVYFTPENTFFVEKPGDKDEVAQKLGITHFIDDERLVLARMPSVGARILFDSRELFEAEVRYVRVKNWSDLEALIG